MILNLRDNQGGTFIDNIQECAYVFISPDQFGKNVDRIAYSNYKDISKPKGKFWRVVLMKSDYGEIWDLNCVAELYSDKNEHLKTFYPEQPKDE